MISDTHSISTDFIKDLISIWLTSRNPVITQGNGKVQLTRGAKKEKRFLLKEKNSILKATHDMKRYLILLVMKELEYEKHTDGFKINNP